MRSGLDGSDVAALGRHGYRHLDTTLVDLFPHTPHLEAVTAVRAGVTAGPDVTVVVARA